MQLVALLFNLPWNVAGLIVGVCSLPSRITIAWRPPALVLHVRSLWWMSWMPGRGGLRAATTANIVLMSPKSMAGDLEHELIHVGQSMRAPLVYPFLYALESFKHGYRKNKYEVEAYERAGNRYIEN